MEDILIKLAKGHVVYLLSNFDLHFFFRMLTII